MTDKKILNIITQKKIFQIYLKLNYILNNRIFKKLIINLIKKFILSHFI